MQAAHVEVTRLIEEREFQAARRLCEGVIEDQPGAFAPFLWMAHVALAEGRPQEARTHLSAASGRGAPESRVARLELALARAEGLPRLPLLERLVVLEPREPRWLQQALPLQLAAGRGGEALRTLAALFEVAPDAVPAVDLEGLAQRMPADSFIEFSTPLAAAAPRHWTLRTVRAAAFANADRMDEAWDEIRAALDIDADKSFPPCLQAAIAVHYSASDAERDRFEALMASRPRSGALFWCRVMCIDAMGEPGRARAIVRDNWEWARRSVPPALEMWEHLEAGPTAGLDDPGSPVHVQLLIFNNRLQEAIEAAPKRQDIPLLRQALALSKAGLDTLPASRDPGEITVAGRNRPNGTVLFFTAMRDQATLPVHVMDLFFAAHGLKAIYLRDYSRLGYLAGLKTVGPSFEATVEHLSREIGGDGRPLYTMGLSVGGMAAVAYAEALGAKASLVFSAQSSFDPAVVEQLGDRRGRAWYRRLKDNVETHRFDMCTILPRMSGDYVLTAYAPGANPDDRAHVERIAGFPNVRVRLLEGESDHGILGPAAAREPLMDILGRAFELQPWPSEQAQ